MLARVGAGASRSLRGRLVAGVARPALAANASIRTNSSIKSWVPVGDEKLQQVTMKSLIHEVAEQQRELAAKVMIDSFFESSLTRVSQVVPWFLRQMPAAYFRSVPEHLRSQHVKAITALRDLMQSDLSLKIETKAEDGLQVTYISTHNKPGLLMNQIKTLEIPTGYELSKVNVFSSLDGELALNIFSFEQSKKKEDQPHASMKHGEKLSQFLEEVKSGKYADDASIPPYSDALFSQEAVCDYLNRVLPHYVENTPPKALMQHRVLFEKVRGSDSTSVSINPYDGAEPTSESMSWITIASANVLPDVLLRLCSSIISSRGLDISRAFLDTVACKEASTAEVPGYVTLLRLLVSPIGKQTTPDLNTDAKAMRVLARDLKRAKWLDNETADLGLFKHPHLGLEKAEVVTALCSLLHGPLFKEDPNSYASIKSIVQLVSGNARYIGIADSIASTFLDRFNPASPLSHEEFAKRTDEIRKKISVVQVESARRLLNRMLDAVQSTLRTNFFNEERYALSTRLEPSFMVSSSKEYAGKAIPFGVFFVHGRNFNAFHNRFRDIARGGLRLVTPGNSDQYAIESTRQYDEVYGLSYAQQLKNKDIPEGGSKGVILVNTPGMNESTKFFAMRKSVKAFADSLLDLIVADSVKNLVDLYNKDELIYLGPDEQIIPSDIEWIISRAAERGYPIPAAFMSSKKDDGFNHKEFGVTSEGVVVYLDVALRKALNIDPKTQPFTVKITGGPDGDVAGNLMKILSRDYGTNAKILAVADGFGVAEDPEGLDHGELLRLFYEAKPIDQFSKSKLSSKGIVMNVSTEEGQQRRNTMHFRIKSDVFVPAGGRPNTINNENWKNFLDETGKPSSPLIVEGANIFITPDARKNLFEQAGVKIVKDSSANKCGVITSSFEIACSMLIKKEEFMSIKPDLVEDVLERLRCLARLEGELLFREFALYPGALPFFSERISLAIAKVTDAITDRLAIVQPEDELFNELRPVINEHLPKKLVEFAGDRIASKFPVQYQRNAIASGLASKLVYQEGIHLVETQPLEKLAERAFEYYRAERHVKKVLGDLQSSTIQGPAAGNKEEIIDLLQRGGARTKVDIF
jgi:glutamate dehydrogenase